jgi:phosphodiesterase/alkaline phosphatase D-like protein
VFSSSYTNSRGAEVVLEVSDPTVITASKGASPLFPVIIDSKAGNTITMSSVTFGATLSHSGDPKLVATMTLTLSNTFSPITIKVISVNFGGAPVNSGITFELTKPSNNRISNVLVTPSHNGATINWSTLFSGTSSVITLNKLGETTTTTVPVTLTTASADHLAKLTGLTAATTYEYTISSTSTSGEISPTTKRTFKTRATPDTRPVAISNFSYNQSGSSVTFTWVTNRPADSRIKIVETIDLIGSPTTPTVVDTQANAQGTTQHRIKINNLTNTFFNSYNLTITSRGVGLDALITENLMTEAQVTATQTPFFYLSLFNFTRPLSSEYITFFGGSRTTSGTDQATLKFPYNQDALVRVFYKVAPTSGTPDAAYFNDAASVASTQALRNHTITLNNLESGKRYAVLAQASTTEIPSSQPTEYVENYTTTTSENLSFRTHAKVDPATITLGPQVIPRSELVVVVYGTDIPTTSQIFVGTTGTGGTLGTADEIKSTDLTSDGKEQLSKRHAHLITGLKRGTQYGYRIEATNTAGQVIKFDPFNSSTKPGVLSKQVVGASGGFGTTTVDDTQFPIITRGPTVINKTEASLTIEWDTDEVSNSTVNYGTKPDSLNGFQISGEPVSTHRITLSGLTAGTTYYYQVGSTDISNNGPVQGPIVSATTLTQPDITAPTFTVVPNASYIADTRVDLAWTTNELSGGEVNYGTSATSLDQFTTLENLSLKNGITLAGLTAGTTYFYQVLATDLNGNGPTKSEVLSFTTLATADTQAPAVTTVAVSPTDSAAVVTWTTDELANSVVQFGLSADSLNTTVSDINPTTAHKLVLANLTPATTYSYRVQSSDPAKNGPTSSTTATFTTAAAGGAQGPDAPTGLSARAGNGVVQLSWNAPVAGAIGLLLERAPGDGNFTALATLAPTTTYVDNSVANDTAYQYRLTAQGLFQRSGAPSTATAAVTPSSAVGPSAPTLFAVQGTPTRPTLVINNSTPQNATDQVIYTVQVSTQADFSTTLEISPPLNAGAGRGTSDPANITVYTVGNTLTDGTTYYYRIKANDGFSDSPFLSGSFKVNAKSPAYPGDLTGDLAVGFPDFIQFVGSFNKTPGQTGYNAAADLNGDGTIGFPDFLTFVSVFNKKYIQGGSSSGKPVLAVTFGQDSQAQFNLIGHFVQSKTGRELAVDVQLKEASDLQGYGIQVSYDPTVLEFIAASDAGATLLKSGDRSAEIFGVLDHNKETGDLYIASAVTRGASVSGSGTLGTLTFRLLDPNPLNADIQIAQGILFNPALNGFIATNLGDRFSLIPTEYALDHNFPNPFNPETTLRYAIPNAGFVTLSIYNVLGQEVVRLVDSEQMPGFYAMSWNGKDASGQTVASGVYLYRIQAGDFHQTHKMMLLK